MFDLGERVAGIYEIRAKLGEGGMAQVFEAEDLLLDRRIALKAALPIPNAPSLRNEARALAAFSHPSLVTVHTAGVHRGVEFIVMERVYGVSLAEHIRQRRDSGTPFALGEVLESLTLIAEGLAVVHRAGIAHRDIKPGNIMLTPDQRVVLMDFGLVLAAQSDIAQPFVAGSPPYMPPESLMNSTEPGQEQQADIYALGVIAFELLAGRRPWAATTIRELWALHESETPPSIRGERPDVPAKLAELISAMLAKQPRCRPASAEGIAWMLASIRDHVLGEGEAAGASTQAPPRFRVLIAEDDDDIARILGFYVRSILAEADVQLERARDGREAVQRLRERAPDLMLLDLHMPRMNGIEVCMQVRGERLAERTKIVAVSAGAQEHDLQLLHKLGMHHFIEKGSDMRTRLANVIRTMFLE